MSVLEIWYTSTMSVPSAASPCCFLWVGGPGEASNQDPLGLGVAWIRAPTPVMKGPVNGASGDVSPAGPGSGGRMDAVLAWPAGVAPLGLVDEILAEAAPGYPVCVDHVGAALVGPVGVALAGPVGVDCVGPASVDRGRLG